MNPIKNSFSIKNLENISGIKAHTIRIWEKRYAILSPNRSQTNIRRYSLESLKKLLNITLLYKSGYKISKISTIPSEELETIVKAITLNSTAENVYVNLFKLSMISFDKTMFYKTFNKIISEHDFEFIYIKIFIPLMNDLGILWQTHSISISHEHFITNLIKQQLHVKTEILNKKSMFNKSKIKFILFLPENEFHELSILFLNYLILSHGFKTIFLGQSTPNKDLKTILNNDESMHFISFFTVRPNKEEIINYLIDFKEQILINKNIQLSIFGPQISLLLNIRIPDKINLFYSLDEFKNKILLKKR
tara:strand:+ start:963 stop:1880 length:918 start_codon:yes stop_codon:yes gene_type:complete